jgi:hypothetical protein
MISQVNLCTFQTISGNKEFSQTIFSAINSAICIIPSNENVLIKNIKLSAFTTSGLHSIEQFKCHFRGHNNDGSQITENAGIINNPISGDWGSAFVKDTVLDFILTSKKPEIVFKQPIILGGFKPVSADLIFSSVLTNNRFTRFYLTVNYETLTNRNL